MCRVAQQLQLQFSSKLPVYVAGCEGAAGKLAVISVTTGSIYMLLWYATVQQACMVRVGCHRCVAGADLGVEVG